MAAKVADLRSSHEQSARPLGRCWSLAVLLSELRLLEHWPLVAVIIIRGSPSAVAVIMSPLTPVPSVFFFVGP